MNIRHLTRVGQMRGGGGLRFGIRKLLEPYPALAFNNNKNIRCITMDLDGRQTPPIGSPTDNKLKSINFKPFLKSLFLGEFNASILSYAEVINYDRYFMLQDQLKHINTFFKENKETIDDMEERGVVPDHLLKKIQVLEMSGLLVPKEYGGAELLNTEALRLLQELGKSFTLAELFRMNELMCTKAIVLHGSQEQKDKYLEKIATGDMWTAYCFTEKNAGSDPNAVEAKATRCKDTNTFHIKGEKTWVANALRADLFLVFAKVWEKDYTGNYSDEVNTFLIERNTPGLSISQPYNLSSLNGLQVCDVTLDCTLPETALLGDPGTGLQVLKSINHDNKYFLGGAVVTRLTHLLDKTVKHALARYQFGAPLASFELIKQQIGMCASEIYALEAMLYITSGLADVGEKPDTELESAVVKEFAQRASNKCTQLCLSILGAQTNLADSEWAQFLHDNQVLQSWQGSSNINKCFIGLSGIMHLVQEKGDDMRKTMEPGLNPFKRIKYGFKLQREIKGRFPKRFKIDNHVHPRFANISYLVDEAACRLNIMGEMMLVNTGLNAQVYECNLEVMSDFTMEVYAMVCALSRASRSYIVGHAHHNHDVELAIGFISKSHGRTDKLWRDFLSMSKYRGITNAYLVGAGEYLLKQGKYCAVNPLIKNSF
eukprot:TRINITY_DN1932_c0_g1_i3.p1 TRINITY_DN1932_c0_g1~~TRINITY_DN1932_c0_g1_i3.p1  ORF type:complete len:657 (-),score=102.47 TRINITY_DN1932_c0_g1_i3:97-2067(-)